MPRDGQKVARHPGTRACDSRKGARNERRKLTPTLAYVANLYGVLDCSVGMLRAGRQPATVAQLLTSLGR